MKDKQILNVRYAALQALERIEKGGAYSNLLLNDMINKGDFSIKDSHLLTELVYGSLSRKLLLEFYLQPFIAQAKKIDNWVRLLLELSLYQMLYLDRVPDHAVINEAVEIAKKRGNVGISKFVNGVLRNIQRQGVPKTSLIKDPIKRLATEISLPQWLTRKLVAQIGQKETKKLGLALFTPSHVSIRIDERRISRQEAINVLAAEGIKANKSPLSPCGLFALKGSAVKSSLFKNGLATLQDETSMLVAPILQIEKSNQVLDACAAPGGKTTHIATYLSAAAGGKVVALDLHQHKVQLIKENARRLHLTQVVDSRRLDARQVAALFSPATFDRILVDAPCSGLGLMRRKPDIRYTKQPDDFKRLAALQLEILTSIAPTLKVGGRLVYSTCTIFPEENQQVVKEFLRQHPEFELLPVPVSANLRESLSDQMLTIYPHQYNTDGFFISCLRKKQ
ncbi:MAG TPA: 16S rRNA (cytosine(967)-C(5))-methyltransferase RsmB [Tetragenococcus sp.]|nr:16S rRNA (cytosine(967)-C(5))-methyltransferase RsmB [Tetragenococcus sp.]